MDCPLHSLVLLTAELKNKIKKKYKYCGPISLFSQNAYLVEIFKPKEFIYDITVLSFTHARTFKKDMQFVLAIVALAISKSALLLPI